MFKMYFLKVSSSDPKSAKKLTPTLIFIMELRWNLTLDWFLNLDSRLHSTPESWFYWALNLILWLWSCSGVIFRSWILTSSESGVIILPTWILIPWLQSHNFTDLNFDILTPKSAWNSSIPTPAWLRRLRLCNHFGTLLFNVSWSR